MNHLQSPGFNRDQTILIQSKDLYRYIFVLIYNLFFPHFFPLVLESHLENRINDAVDRKLPGPSVFLLHPDSPIPRMFTTVNQVHSQQGLHLLFLLGGLGCKRGSVLLQLSL